MLEKVNLNLKLNKAKYKKVLPDLQRRLYDLQKTCWDNKIASIIVFEGWQAAGKGSAVNTLTGRLDPRGFKLHPIQPPRTYEKCHPWLWRFWLRLPSYGEVAIFDHSWYGRVLDERVEGLVEEQEWRKAYRDILELEHMLADDGVVIIKFWFHISKKEQKKRFRQIEQDPLENWRITPEDWERYQKYSEYLVAAEEMLELTDSEYGPWTIVEATSRWYSRKKVLDTVIKALEDRLGKASPPRVAAAPLDQREADLRAAMDAAEAAMVGKTGSKKPSGRGK